MSQEAYALGGGRRQSESDRAEAPLVSVVVVVFRACKELERLLRNLAPFRCPELEVVVIDGGSEDGSAELLAASGELVEAWRSEPDGGIYDAMNKGIELARGAYVLHLNAGDGLLALPLTTLRVCLAESVDLASFRVLVDGRRVFRPRLGLRSRLVNTLHHQGTFYRRAALLPYDTTFRVHADFDLNARLRHAGRTVRLFDEVVAEHATGGASTLTATHPATREVWRIVRRNFGFLWVPVSFVWLNLYFAVQRLRAARAAREPRSA